MSDLIGWVKWKTWQKAWRRPWTWGMAVISLGLLVWILWRANLDQVSKALRSADYSLVVLGLPVILVGLILRALRWRILLAPLGMSSFGASFTSMMIGYLANNLLPARAGELVRAYVLSQRAGISKSANLATIVVERVADGLVLVVALSTLLIVFPMPAWVHQVALVGSIVFVGAILILVTARSGRQQMQGILGRLLSTGPRQWKVRSISIGSNFLLGLTSFRGLFDVFAYLLLTVLAWSTDVLLFWLVMQAFGITLPVLAVILVMATGALSTSIPALPGYVGTYQFAIVSVLESLQVDAVPATAFALGVHGLVWLTVNTVGLLVLTQQGLSVGIIRVESDLT